MQWLRFELWLGWQLKPSRNLLGVLVMGLFNGRASKKILWSNPALNLAPFGRWTLRDEAAQRR